MGMQLRRRRTIAGLLLLALLGTACSGSATTITEASTDTSPDTATATSAPEPTAEPAATATPEPAEPTAAPAEPTATPEPTPEPAMVFFGSDLQPGDCFNRLDGNPEFQPPTIVSCNELHDEEVYAVGVLDDPAGAPYPGDDAIVDRVALELCDAATIDFLGAPWDVVPVDTLLLYPTEDEWVAGDRNVLCTAVSPDEAEQKIGTAAGGTLDTDDVLVARASISSDGVDFDDLVVVTEYAGLSDLGSLSDGQFDLPLRRPFSIPDGFMFNASGAGSDDFATSGWGYNWRDQEFTDLGSILPGQELSSWAVGDGAIIFAARATPADDWDLWSAAGGEAEVIAGGPGDQQYPTLTPDKTRIVYQDNGDIWVAAPDGSDALQLTSGPANDWESIVSPDGQTVVFSSDRTGDDDLWAVDISGGEPINLTNHPGDDVWPVFSEDGSMIYFASDRLVPEADRTVIMMMNADGSNQSWFAATSTSHPIVVPEAVAAQVVANAPTLNERYNYDLVAGEPGTTVTWTHSNGRLSAELPAGWRVGEYTELNGFIAGPRPDHYFDTWNVDGVSVTLWDGESEADFFTIVGDADAQGCDQFDGTVPIAEDIVGLSANFNCGSGGAVGGVIAFYNQVSGVGVMIEGQRDNLPDIEQDSDMLTAIARSVVWE